MLTVLTKIGLQEQSDLGLHCSTEDKTDKAIKFHLEMLTSYVIIGANSV